MKVKKRSEVDALHIAFIAMVTREFGYNYSKIVSKKKNDPDLVELRKLITFVLYHTGGLTYAKIGGYMKRNHSAALYSVKRVTELMEVDKGFKVRYFNDLQMIKSHYKQMIKSHYKIIRFQGFGPHPYMYMIMN